MNELAQVSFFFPVFWATAHSLTSRCPSSWSGGSPACPSPALVLDSTVPPATLSYVTPQLAWPPQHPCYITSSWLPPASPHTGPWVPPTSPCQAQPNAHLHDQGKFDPGSRFAVKSENPGHLGNCLLAQPSGLLVAQGGTALHLGSARAHPTL